MNACWLVVLLNTLPAHSLTVNRKKYRDTVTKTKIELKPVHFTCAPNDIIKISAPIINEESLYYMNRPNGEVIKLDLSTPKKNINPIVSDSLNLLYKNDNIKPIVVTDTNNGVFSLKQDEYVFKSKEEGLNTNEFLLGPVGEEDHGNWVLSVYAKDYNGKWIEIFQIITIEIIEYVPVDPVEELKAGGTLNLRFAYPIKDLVSCELIAPGTSYDRIFERSHFDMDRCHFTLRNITIDDSGVWAIVAVGRIVYEGGTSITVL